LRRSEECDGTFDRIFGDAANGLVEVKDGVEEKRKLKHNSRKPIAEPWWHMS
jgi:hypothetical protein